MRQEFELFRNFNAKVGRLERTRFVKRFEDNVPEVFMSFEELKITDLGGGRLNFFGKLKSWVPDFDEDEIDAFVLTYRMLTQNNDRLSVASIAKIYEKDWMPIEAASNFREAREHLNKYLDSAAAMEFGSQQMAIREIVDIVIYGGLAHSNHQKAKVFDAWRANHAISGLMWVEFMAAMNKAFYIFSFIRKLNNAVIEADI
jgi:hypothetical protein